MARPAKKQAKSRASSERTLATMIAAAPRFTDRKAAEERVAEWLADIGRRKAGKTLGRLIEESPRLKALLAGLADGSPYLWDLATAEPERLLALLHADPDRHFTDLLAATRKAIDAAEDDADV